MRVRHKSHWHKFNTPDGTMSIDGEGLVGRALEDGYARGELESLQERINTLSQIVGRLIDELPEDRRIEVAGLQFKLEQA